MRDKTGALSRSATPPPRQSVFPAYYFTFELR